jgi:hypothetical protein
VGDNDVIAMLEVVQQGQESILSELKRIANSNALMNAKMMVMSEDLKEALGLEDPKDDKPGLDEAEEDNDV